MSLTEHLQTLRDLGAPDSFFSVYQRIVRDQHDTYHTGVEHCPSDDAHEDDEALSFEDVTISLDSIPPGDMCVCLTGDPDDPENAGFLLPLFLSAIEEVGAAEDYVTPEGQASHYRTLGAILEALWGKKAVIAWDHPDLLPVLHSTTELVREAQGNALVRLRSPEMRSLLHKDRRPAPLTHVVAFRHPLLIHFMRRDSLDAHLLSYGTGDMDADAIIQAVLPQDSFDMLWSWAQEIPKRSSGDFQVRVLRPKDTPAVVETALSLWDPLAGGTFSQLDNVFEAAHSV